CLCVSLFFTASIGASKRLVDYLFDNSSPYARPHRCPPTRVSTTIEAGQSKRGTVPTRSLTFKGKDDESNSRLPIPGRSSPACRHQSRPAAGNRLEAGRDHVSAREDQRWWPGRGVVPPGQAVHGRS